MTLRNPLGLLPYQLPHTEALVHSLRREGTILDASDTGTGKTYTLLATARETGLTPAIVAPKSVLPAWEKVAAHFRIRPYFLTSWESAKSAKFAHGEFDKRDGSYLWHLGKTKVLLVFDEAHKGKGEDTQASRLMIAAKRQELPTACLSATIATSPRDMWAMGYLYGLHDLTQRGFREWTKALGCYQKEDKDGRIIGWSCLDPKEAMGNIHRYLFPRFGARMQIKDLGDQFPETQITAELYPIAKAKVQNAAYDELLGKIAKLKEEKKDGWPAAAMTLNLRYRQLSEMLKVDLLVQLTRDALENGLSVAVFVNYNETREQLIGFFGGAVTVHGTQSIEERKAAIKAFGEDSARVCIANIRAGGTGVDLHDLRGQFPRMAILCPTYSAVDLRQALGRVRRAGGKSKSLQRIVYAAGTVEVDVCKKVAGRLSAIDALNTGDLMEKDLFGVLAA